MLRLILNIADFVLPSIPLLIVGQAAMDAFPLIDGERSWTGVLVVFVVSAPLFGWWLYTWDRLLRSHPTDLPR